MLLSRRCTKDGNNPCSLCAAPQIAVEGCCHGELDRIYATLKAIEEREGKRIDLLVCCGDFQVSSAPKKTEDFALGRLLNVAVVCARDFERKESANRHDWVLYGRLLETWTTWSA